MARGILSRWVLVAVFGLVLSGCAHPVEATRAGAAMFVVGDCVEIPSTAPAELKAGKADCATDPSYTVGALADEAGNCPSAEYQRLPAEAADAATARLCLVPNLVADHCYVLDMPIGVVQRADCNDRKTAGLLVQVTQRLDVRDQQACPSDVGQFAWPYPSPARTYCTLTVF